MAIAFGALLFSTSISLNELAFILTASVLVDTLVVRTVLVPSAMAVLGRANWWPRRLPRPVPSTDLLPLPPAPAGPDAADGGDGSGVPPDYETTVTNGNAGRPGSGSRAGPGAGRRLGPADAEATGEAD
mmetsp:Transcript_9509/g.32240  ORF Transcript_9509/g.32240 Transcript_9509/m.32240 type:complete len:129 (+) Transcript_9509:180-566(+)